MEGSDMLTTGDPVSIYWNLHRNVFSVLARSGPQRGRVVAHVDSFTLNEVTFVVRNAGRQRVLREQRKNVHAFVTGSWMAPNEATGTPVRYNPYTAGHFVADGHPIHTAPVAHGVTVNGRPSILATV